MRALIFIALFSLVIQAGLSQTEANVAPGLPKDPREIFAAAAPFYDFSDASLKPWHLKASYQLYDQDGKPSGQGTYEYWWASPKVHRSTWSRGNITRTDWHTADGQHLFHSTGERLQLFEIKLQAMLISPLPGPADLDPDKVRLEREDRSLHGVKAPCISLVSVKQGHAPNLPMNFYPIYCFDSHLPVLRFSYTFGEAATLFNGIAKFQGRFLARQLLILVGDRNLLSANVDAVEGMDAADPHLTPDSDALPVRDQPLEADEKALAASSLKKQAPVYPLVAKQLHQ